MTSTKSLREPPAGTGTKTIATHDDPATAIVSLLYPLPI